MDLKSFFRTSFVLMMTLVMVGCGRDAVSLKMNWAEGDSFRYVQTLDQTITQKIQGREQEIDQKQVMTFRYDVRGDTNAGRVIGVTMERIQQDQSMQGQQFSYDSDQPEQGNHPASAAFQKLVGRSYDIVMTPEGQVEEVRGLDEIYDDLAEGNPKQRQLLKEHFGEDAIKQMINQMFQVHEGKPRTVGETWSHSLSMTKPIPMVMNLDFTLESIEGDDVNITIDSTVEPNEEAPPMEMGPMTMRYMIEGEQSGNLIFSRSDQFIRSQEYEQHFEGTMHMEGSPAGPQEVPIQIDGTYKMEGEKL